MSETKDKLDAPASTTPPGSPPRGSYYGQIPHGEAPASTTPPGSPPGHLCFPGGLFMGELPLRPATQPGTPRALSVAQVMKGNGRADTTVPAPGDTTAASSDAEVTSSEAAMTKALDDLSLANESKVTDVKDTPSVEKAGRGRDNSRAEHPNLGGNPAATANRAPTNNQAGTNNRAAPNNHAAPTIPAGTNIPDRTEAFLLGDGEKKVEEYIDTRTPNTMKFIYNKEDHTIAGPLVAKLHKNSHVVYVGYRVPHPLFASFELRIRTDGEIDPKEALLAASREIIRDLEILKIRFTREYELRKMVGNAAQNNGA